MLTLRGASTLSMEALVCRKQVGWPARRQSRPRLACRNARASNRSVLSLRVTNSGRDTHGVAADRLRSTTVCAVLFSAAWITSVWSGCPAASRARKPSPHSSTYTTPPRTGQRAAGGGATAATASCSAAHAAARRIGGPLWWVGF